MCLFTKESKPNISTKDIFCYKIICHCDGNSYYTTPIRNYVIPKLPFMLDDTNNCGEIDDYLSGWTPYAFIISKGFIHAFQSIEFAEKECPECLLIILCIIPKGTKYFIGNMDDICAKKMILTDIIIKEKYCDIISKASICKVIRFKIIYNIKLFFYKLKILHKLK